MCSCSGRAVSGATSAQALLKREWNSWKGRAALETILHLVASVHNEMQMMFDAPGAEQIFGRGQGCQASQVETVLNVPDWRMS